MLVAMEDEDEMAERRLQERLETKLEGDEDETAPPPVLPVVEPVVGNGADSGLTGPSLVRTTSSPALARSLSPRALLADPTLDRRVMEKSGGGGSWVDTREERDGDWDGGRRCWVSGFARWPTWGLVTSSGGGVGSSWGASARWEPVESRRRLKDREFRGVERGEGGWARLR